MNTKLRTPSFKRARLLATACLLLALLAPLMARAQVTASRFQTALTNAFTLGGTLYTNISALGRPLDVPQGRGLSINARYYGASSIYTTGLVAFGFSTSYDGTNYSTYPNLLWAHVGPQGTTNVLGYTNWSSAILDNVLKIKLHTITNAMTATNMAGYVTNVYVGSH